MGSTEHARTGPARRQVMGRLAGLAGGVAAAGLLAACTGGKPSVPGADGRAGTSPSPPSADRLATDRAVATTRRLLADAEALRPSSHAPLATVLGLVVTDDLAHLTALGVPATASPSPTTTAAGAASGAGSPPGPPSTSAPAPGSTAGSASTSGSPSTSASAPPVTAARLVAAERAAVTEALADLGSTGARTAQLLTRVAAGRAVHADLVARAAKVTPPAPDPAPDLSTLATLDSAGRRALAAWLAGEHAAVFAYGWVTARVGDADVARARAAWRLHVARRDDLERALSAAGQTPAAAQPAYDLGTTSGDASAAAGLAARVEAGLGTVAVSGAGATTGPVRRVLADAAVAAARRSATWSGHPVSL